MMSVLCPIRNFLNYSNILGFLPFKINFVEGENKVIFSAKSACCKCAFYLSFIILYNLSIFVPHIIYHGSFDINYIQELTKVSTIDFVSVITSFAMSLVCSIRMFFLLKFRAEEIIGIFLLLNQFKTSAELGVKSKNQLMRLSIFIFSSCFVGSAFVCAGIRIYYRLILGGFIPDIWHHFMTFLAFGASIFHILSPFIFIGAIFAQYIFMTLTEVFDNWCDSAKKMNNDSVADFKDRVFNVAWDLHDKEKHGTGERLKEFDRFMDKGFELCRITERLNTALAPITSLLFAYVLTATICSLYLEFGTVLMNFNEMMTFVSGGFAIENVALLWALYFMFDVGHKLDAARFRAKATLEDTFLEIGGDKNCKMDILLARLETPGAVSPFGYFSVNRNSFLSAIATSFTYLVVLMQFKISEK